MAPKIGSLPADLFSEYYNFPSGEMEVEYTSYSIKKGGSYSMDKLIHGLYYYQMGLLSM